MGETVVTAIHKLLNNETTEKLNIIPTLLASQLSPIGCIDSVDTVFTT